MTKPFASTQDPMADEREMSARLKFKQKYSLVPQCNLKYEMVVVS